jgi:hypothetical protein
VLARPLGFRLRGWTTDPQGIHFGGNEMRMTPREMLAFGTLYLNGGRAPDGTQVVPRAWIDSSWVVRTRSPFNGNGYGYGWWHRRLAGHDVHFAWGYGGQFVFVVPDRQLVVVTTSNPDVERERGHLDAIYGLLEREILPAVGGGSEEHGVLRAGPAAEFAAAAPAAPKSTSERHLVHLHAQIARDLSDSVAAESNAFQIDTPSGTHMRTLYALALLAVAPTTAAHAQIGRLPLLAALPAAEGACRSGAMVTNALRPSGITRLVNFNGGTPSRLVAVGMDSLRRPVHLTVMASVPAGATRREGESVSIFFTPTGVVRTGSRRYFTTGTPASLSDDRQSGLLPADTAPAFALAQAVVQRCGR